MFIEANKKQAPRSVRSDMFIRSNNRLISPGDHRTPDGVRSFYSAASYKYGTPNGVPPL